MKKQLTVAAGILVMLGAAVSGAFGDADRTPARASVESAQFRLNPAAADRMLAKLNAAPASVPLARPL